MSANDLARLNFVGFLLEQNFVTASAGSRADFSGFLVNLTDNDIKVGGYGAGIIVPEGLHGSAFPFLYNPALPQTVSRLSVVGPMRLFSVELPYGSLRPSDQFLLGHTAPTFKEVNEETEGDYRGGQVAFFQINLQR